MVVYEGPMFWRKRIAHRRVRVSWLPDNHRLSTGELTSEILIEFFEITESSPGGIWLSLEDLPLEMVEEIRPFQSEIVLYALYSQALEAAPAFNAVVKPTLSLRSLVK